MVAFLPRGPTRSDTGSYFIPKKIPTSELVYPNKSLVLFSKTQKVHIYTHTYTHTHMYTVTHIRTHIYMYTHTHQGFH